MNTRQRHADVHLQPRVVAVGELRREERQNDVAAHHKLLRRARAPVRRFRHVSSGSSCALREVWQLALGAGGADTLSETTATSASASRGCMTTPIPDARARAQKARLRGVVAHPAVCLAGYRSDGDACALHEHSVA